MGALMYFISQLAIHFMFYQSKESGHFSAGIYTANLQNTQYLRVYAKKKNS